MLKINLFIKKNYYYNSILYLFTPIVCYTYYHHSFLKIKTSHIVLYI